MDAIISENTVPLAEADGPPATGTPEFATNGVPGSTVPTQFPAYHYNGMTQEILSLQTGAGLANNRQVLTQVLQAVKRFSGGNVTTVTGSTTLTADNAGLVLVNAAAGNIVITQPAVASANGIPLKFEFMRSDATANTVAIVPSGTDLMPDGAASTPLIPRGWLSIIGDGISQWRRPSAALNQISGVVGSVRNLVMSIAAASSTATMAADEIIVETQLGGIPFRLANFNTSINLATIGAGGMDTGAPPISGYVAIYAIFNPTTGAGALMATNATTTIAPSVYGGANMPTGFTASALVSVWPTTAGEQFKVGLQIDRVILILGGTALTTSTTQATPTALSISGFVPPNARSASGTMSVSSTSATPNTSLVLSSTSLGFGGQGVNDSMGATGGISVNYNKLPILTAQTIFYTAAETSGAPTFVIGVTGYEI